MSLFVGIDPGLSGAIAIYRPLGDALTVLDVPVHELTRNGKHKREVDTQCLVDLIGDLADACPVVFIENSTPMPGQGAASTFAFGKTFGIIYGVCAAHKLVIHKVAPVKWKRDLAVPKDKDGARARASALMPKHSHHWPLKKHDGRAEAALIALWGSQAFAAQGVAA